MSRYVILRVVLGVAALGWAGAASAQRVSLTDGNRLMGYCLSKTPGACDAYISGVADAIALLSKGPSTAAACIPTSVSGGQLHDVVVKYLKAHPEKRELKAGSLTISAFSEAFPCKR
jgi:hypothetical protein